MATFFEAEDIPGLRMRHESNAEWRLREHFLLAHLEKYDQGRLVCLSQCFINVECYGTKYPLGVMTELDELTPEIAEALGTHRSRMDKLRESITFVKASAK